MNYLRPHIVRIDGSNYRVREEQGSRTFGQDEEECFNIEERNGEDEWTVEEEEKWCLEYLSHDRYMALIDIPTSFYGYLIGRKGATRREFENELQVKIQFPTGSKHSSEEKPVKVLGTSKGSVMTACRRLHIKVMDLRSKSDWTHFISVPLNIPHIQEAFSQFCNKVSLSEPTLDEKIFQNPQLLHLTIGVMALLTEKELMSAKEALNECLIDIIRPILGKKELKLSIRRLQIMNDDPSEVKVIYAEIFSDHLQKISDLIVDKFVAKGLMTRQYESVTLHMTVLNTKFISPPMKDDKRHRQNKITIDATRILNDYREEEFGDVVVKEMHLSKMPADKKLLKGFYECFHAIRI